MLDSRLVYVVAVARSGSFTGAAAAAGVTQSAITRSVADLEKEIGYAIFHRVSRGVALTERGAEFVKRAGRLLEDARELLHGQASGGDPYAGVLRVGVCPSSLEWRLSDCQLDLLRRYPALRLDVSSSAFETVVRQLQSGALDVAFGFDAAFADWADLHREQMGLLDAALFVRLGHPLLGGGTVTEADLARYDFVSPSESRPYGEVIRSLYELAGEDWQARVHRVDFFPMVKRIVAHSDAIGLVAASYARRPEFARHFAVLDGVDIFPNSRLCCAVRARWEPEPATRAFLAAVRRSVAA